MNGFRLAALVSFLSAVGILTYAVWTGAARVGVFLVVPFVVGSGFLPLAGMALLFAAFILWSVGSFRELERRAVDERPAWNAPRSGEPAARNAEPSQASARSGGVILLGPIPIVWGSDRRILPWMVAAGALLLLLALAFTFTAGRA